VSYEVKLGKVNGDTDRNALVMHNVMAFPTILFFRKGERIDFNGDRTKDGIINWINKKILPLLTEVDTQAKLDELKTQDIPSLVLFSRE
jgi:protein disulfide-isomerase A1